MAPDECILYYHSPHTEGKPYQPVVKDPIDKGEKHLRRKQERQRSKKRVPLRGFRA